MAFPSVVLPTSASVNNTPMALPLLERSSLPPPLLPPFLSPQPSQPVSPLSLGYKNKREEATVDIGEAIRTSMVEEELDQKATEAEPKMAPSFRQHCRSFRRCSRHPDLLKDPDSRIVGAERSSTKGEYRRYPAELKIKVEQKESKPPPPPPPLSPPSPVEIEEENGGRMNSISNPRVTSQVETVTYYTSNTLGRPHSLMPLPPPLPLSLSEFDVNIEHKQSVLGRTTPLNEVTEKIAGIREEVNTRVAGTYGWDCITHEVDNLAKGILAFVTEQQKGDAKTHHEKEEMELCIHHLGSSLGLPKWTRKGYKAEANKTKQHALTSCIFKIILSQHSERRSLIDPMDNFRALRAVNPSPFENAMEGEKTPVEVPGSNYQYLQPSVIISEAVKVDEVVKMIWEAV
ncbi:hypothetical protein LXL04_038066 [Taraxacum kok-saghyz]